MLIGKKFISRRQLLHGAGVTLALPLLDAMIPAGAAFGQSASQAPARFVAIFYPHGMAPGYWAPDQPGALPQAMPYILESLAPLRDRTVVLSGLWAKSAEPPDGSTGSDQFVSAAFLTAIKPKKTSGVDRSVGSPTIDQTIAKRIGQNSRIPSLQLVAEELNETGASCGEGYSCWYTNTISWADANTPLPMELNPQVVFERLFGEGVTAEEREQRRLQKRSILDGIVSELTTLRGGLGASDKRALDAFTDDVRAVEQRIEQLTNTYKSVPQIDQPLATPVDYDDLIKLHYDLVTLAFQADLTRVVTMLGARDFTGRTYRYPVSELYPTGGTSPSFSGARHHQNDPAQIRRFATLNRYHVSTMAYLAKKLQSIREGDGTLLDRSLILYGTNMGNSQQHEHFNVPHFLVGAANGRLQGGRHLAYPTRTVTTGNLLLSLLDMFGVQQKSQGDSTGLLAGL
jgi:hypothetical protein